jgi:hypothetical protein
VLSADRTNCLNMPHTYKPTRPGGFCQETHCVHLCRLRALPSATPRLPLFPHLFLCLYCAILKGQGKLLSPGSGSRHREQVALDMRAQMRAILSRAAKGSRCQWHPQP